MYPENIQKILNKENKLTPTLIQEKTFNEIIAGSSLIGLAKTGTGKTLAYGLPALIRIKKIQGVTIILEPTTELAVQTKNSLIPYANALELKIMALVGAGNRKRQLERLRKEKPKVLICTPGRFLDFIAENKIKYQEIKTLIIDEADDILEFTKLEFLSSLGQNLSDDAQILLFGASESRITKDCEEIFDKKFVYIDVRPDQKSQVKHYFLQVSNEYKIQFLQRLAKLDNFKGILFFDSNETEIRFSRIFAHNKTSFAVLHGEDNKQKREIILSNFRKGKTKLLFATDLVARGLDLPDVTYVINFEIPSELNTYMHRSGRTGRMNKQGTVITLGDDHDLRNLKKLLADQYEIERVYFEGYKLTTNKPKMKHSEIIKKTNKNSMSTIQKDTIEKTHKKNRWRNKKNKGYHLSNKKESK